jgi:hypothetical protein
MDSNLNTPFLSVGTDLNETSNNNKSPYLRSNKNLFTLHVSEPFLSP